MKIQQGYTFLHYYNNQWCLISPREDRMANYYSKHVAPVRCSAWYHLCDILKWKTSGILQLINSSFYFHVSLLVLNERLENIWLLAAIWYVDIFVVRWSLLGNPHHPLMKNSNIMDVLHLWQRLCLSRCPSKPKRQPVFILYFYGIYLSFSPQCYFTFSLLFFPKPSATA